ncbi:glycosyltransferase family 4 protein [Nitrospira moscoviensis]|uniref:Putative Glycosyltransferase n=1 Tax=Nitrospira moscoviensis TaxID=42253 RepID=A0A0K2GBG0_NITMO|nr:glycosyltransferase family 4 protein [Nitrospira moscoviensis]ALA58209.1 putative Glycosyltransferase [Nitrospira moscoviensis]
MNWFVFCYWFEPDAPRDPVGLVRIWALADALIQAGDRVTVFAPRYRSASVVRAARVIPIQLMPVRILRPLSYALRSFVSGVARALIARPDVVYYRWMISPHVLVLSKLVGARCICEVNGEPVPEWSNGGKVRRAAGHWIARVSLCRCDRVVVLTEGLRELLVRSYGVAAERIILLPSGTDTERFAPRDPVACRQRLGLPPGDHYIGFVGSFYRYQGLASLMDATAAVRARCSNVRLLMVGDGEAGGELNTQAQKLGLSDSIIWTGRIPYEEVPAYIGAMTVCVAPFCGDRGETSPVKIFDYLACAKPVVASDIPSVRTVFASNRGVQLVPPDRSDRLAEAILSLLHDPDRCRAMGEGGRRFVEQRFGWVSIGERLRARVVETEVTSSHAHAGLL